MNSFLWDNQDESEKMDFKEPKTKWNNLYIILIVMNFMLYLKWQTMFKDKLSVKNENNEECPSF